MLQIPILQLKQNSQIPQYMTEGAAGMDLCAAIDEAIQLKPLERKIIPTGLAIALPLGYEAQIRPRSGLAIIKGITCLNSPGTIDSDYRGEIGVILINLGSEVVILEPGERIAQMVIHKYERVQFDVVSELPSSQRGAGGFGSTGT